MRLPNGINTNGRKIAGVDWSRTEVTIKVKGLPVRTFATLAEAAPHYKKFIWAIEATTDSFELQLRQPDLDTIDSNDIWTFCSNTKYTSQYRIKWGIEKSDESDAGVILRIFTESKLSWARFKQLVEKDPVRDAIYKFSVEDRFMFGGSHSLDVSKQWLPAYADIPEFLAVTPNIEGKAGESYQSPLREFLFPPQKELKSKKSGKPKNPKPKKQIGRFLTAALETREAGGGFRVFERQMGNNGQGYGSMVRSDFYWWLVRPVLNARIKAAKIEKKYKLGPIDSKTNKPKKIRVWTNEELVMRKLVMKQADRMLYWLWKLTEWSAT
jgi:hypothetical protein